MGGGRCVLLFLAAAVVVTFLAYERDEVVRDAEIILHHNLTNHTAARSAPVKDKAAAATVASPKGVGVTLPFHVRPPVRPPKLSAH